MIEVRLVIGSGHRELSRVSDDLIITEAMAMIRARQILARTFNIIHGTKLELWNGYEVEIGDEGHFVNHRLGINGNHLVTEKAVTIEQKKVEMSVTVEQYTTMPDQGVGTVVQYRL